MPSARSSTSQRDEHHCTAAAAPIANRADASARSSTSATSTTAQQQQHTLGSIANQADALCEEKHQRDEHHCSTALQHPFAHEAEMS
jgi:hypothetical protein